MENYVYIYSYPITKELLKNGFIIRDILPNQRYKNRTVFLFKRTQAIEMFLKDIGISA